MRHCNCIEEATNSVIKGIVGFIVFLYVGTATARGENG